MNNIYKSLTILLLSAVNLSAFAKDLPVNMHEGKSSEQPKGMSMGMSEEMKNKKAQKIEREAIDIMKGFNYPDSVIVEYEEKLLKFKKN